MNDEFLQAWNAQSQVDTNTMLPKQPVATTGDAFVDAWNEPEGSASGAGSDGVTPTYTAATPPGAPAAQPLTSAVTALQPAPAQTAAQPEMTENERLMRHHPGYTDPGYGGGE